MAVVGELVTFLMMTASRTPSSSGTTWSERLAEAAKDPVRPVDRQVIGGSRRRAPAVGELPSRWIESVAPGAGSLTAVLCALGGSDVEERTDRAGILEGDGYGLRGNVGCGIGLQTIGQRAGRTLSRLLRRHRLNGRRDNFDVRRRLPAGLDHRLRYRYQLAARNEADEMGGVRKPWRHGIGRLEVQRRSQIAGDRAAPRREVRLDHAETLLDALDDRGVIEHLRADPAAAAPGRDNETWNARAESVRARGEVRVARHARIDLVDRAHRRQTTGCTQRRRRSDQMVEEAVVLVVIHDQHGRCPDLRIGGQRIEHVRHVPGAPIRRECWMLAIGLRRDDPGDLRQGVVLDVALQLLEEGAAVEGTAIEEIGPDPGLVE